MKIRLYDSNRLKYALNLSEVESRTMYDINLKEDGVFTFNRTLSVKNYLVVYSEEEVTFKISQLVGYVEIDATSVLTWSVGPPTVNPNTYLQLGMGTTPYARMMCTGSAWHTVAESVADKVYHEQIYRGYHFIIPLIDITGAGDDSTTFTLIDNTKPVTIVMGYDEES